MYMNGRTLVINLGRGPGNRGLVLRCSTWLWWVLAGDCGATKIKRSGSRYRVARLCCAVLCRELYEGDAGELKRGVGCWV